MSRVLCLFLCMLSIPVLALNTVDLENLFSVEFNDIAYRDGLVVFGMEVADSEAVYEGPVRIKLYSAAEPREVVILRRTLSCDKGHVESVISTQRLEAFERLILELRIGDEVHTHQYELTVPVLPTDRIARSSDLRSTSEVEINELPLGECRHAFNGFVDNDGYFNLFEFYPELTRYVIDINSNEILLTEKYEQIHNKEYYIRRCLSDIDGNGNIYLSNMIRYNTAEIRVIPAGGEKGKCIVIEPGNNNNMLSFDMKAFNDGCVYAYLRYSSSAPYYAAYKGVILFNAAGDYYLQESLLPINIGSNEYLGEIHIDDSGNVRYFTEEYEPGDISEEKSVPWKLYRYISGDRDCNSGIKDGSGTYRFESNYGEREEYGIEYDDSHGCGTHGSHYGNRYFDREWCHFFDTSDISLEVHLGGDEGWYSAEKEHNSSLNDYLCAGSYYRKQYLEGGGFRWAVDRIAGPFRQFKSKGIEGAEIPGYFGGFTVQDADMDADGHLYYYSYYYDYRTEQERYSEDESWTGPTHNISHLRGNMDGDPYGEYDNVNFARGVSGELYMSVYDDRIAKIVRADMEGFVVERADFPVYNFDVAKCPDGRTILFGKGYFGESIGTLYYSIIGEKKLPLKAKLLVYNSAGELHESEDYVPEEGDLFTVKLKLYGDDNGELIETSRGYDEDRMVGFNLFGASASEVGRGFAFTDTLGGLHSGFNYRLLEKGENMVESEYQVVCTNPENALATVYAGVYEEYEPLLMSRTLNRTTAPVSDPIDEDTYEIARNRNLVGKIVFCKSDDTEVDPTEYLPEKGDTFKVKYILEYDDGSEFTGYDKDKTVKFSLEGTKSGEMPLEFVWYDDSTEMKSVTLYGGQTEVECPFLLNSTSYFGVAGVSAAVYPNETDPEKSSEATAETRKELPEDIDNDNMADSWEREYLEFYDYTDIKQFKPEDDIENVNGILQLGDDSTNIQEYKGYIDEYGYHRLNPDEKDVLVEIEDLNRPWLTYLSNNVKLNMIKSASEHYDTFGNSNKCMITIDDSQLHKPLKVNGESSDIIDIHDDGDFFNDIAEFGVHYYSTERSTYGCVFTFQMGNGWGNIWIFLGTIRNLFEKNKLEDLLVIENGEVIGNKYPANISLGYWDENLVYHFNFKNPMELYQNGVHISENLIMKYDGDGDDGLLYGRTEADYINVVLLHETGHLFGLDHPVEITDSVMGGSMLRLAYQLKYTDEEKGMIDIKH
ncbi:hypothetical protein KAU32_11435 [bacterium]|nr:hypothetical protein [bacterium]